MENMPIDKGHDWHVDASLTVINVFSGYASFEKKNLGKLPANPMTQGFNQSNSLTKGFFLSTIR